ncbi:MULTISPECIES: hypothetical protein [Mycetocola]|uniref:Uncharacterized protein n=1 Tax=Mycetocola lacteus TaxID=76637 RepID=A0A3L7ASA0_9MICO|nr:hypothetical protein [Mycetocola lacteus]RLP83004.1 hypothetical protein D9V34_07105 [Mycetocola lacteus]
MFEPEIRDVTPPGGAPIAEVYFGSLARGTATITVWVTTGGTVRELRGAIRQPTVGSYVGYDRAVPTGPASYQAEMFDARGNSLGWTGSRTIELGFTDSWIHNPLDPDGAVRVRLLEGSEESVRRPPQGHLVLPLGRADSIWVGTGRAGVTGVKFAIYTDTVADVERMLAMLGTPDKPLTPIVCFRFGAGQGRLLPSPFYAALPGGTDMQEVSGTADELGVIHEMQATQALPPAPGIFVPLLTYAHLNAYYDSYAAAGSDNQSYATLARRIDIARSA